jgi:hypothetical protein
MWTARPLLIPLALGALLAWSGPAQGDPIHDAVKAGEPGQATVAAGAAVNFREDADLTGAARRPHGARRAPARPEDRPQRPRALELLREHGARE